MPDLIKIDRINGIQLNSEILLKFGFKRTEVNYYEIASCVIDFDNKNIFIAVGDYPNSFEYEIKRPEYVHKFQNLYFALSGIELELQE